MLTPLPFYLLYASLTWKLVQMDLREGLLPDRYLCPLLWAGLLWHLCFHPAFLASAVTGAMTGYCGFAALYWGYRLVRRQEGLGYGDVKYLAALGAWHGWAALPALVLSAAVLAAIFILIQLRFYSRRQVLKNPLPFGPFLAAAGLLSGWQTLVSLSP
ncbi:prepilin peptidase [Pseudenterobacter timonensis]|uniref:prepilin peptidase n=1 Tax=Pseudenterobacter timonensis TaxID=1755099 RepID=UPI00077B7A46|nr:A24 family peptidase [Pseudenterobacter timonensis]